MCQTSESVQTINSVQRDQFDFRPLNAEQRTVMCATLSYTSGGKQYRIHGEIKHHGVDASLSDNLVTRYHRLCDHLICQ